MLDSRIIEVNGIFLGTAVAERGQHGWRFVSADQRAQEADGKVAADYRGAEALARQAFWAAQKVRAAA